MFIIYNNGFPYDIFIRYAMILTIVTHPFLFLVSLSHRLIAYLFLGSHPSYGILFYRLSEEPMIHTCTHVFVFFKDLRTSTA